MGCWVLWVKVRASLVELARSSVRIEDAACRGRTNNLNVRCLKDRTILRDLLPTRFLRDRLLHPRRLTQSLVIRQLPLLQVENLAMLKTLEQALCELVHFAFTHDEELLAPVFALAMLVDVAFISEGREDTQHGQPAVHHPFLRRCKEVCVFRDPRLETERHRGKTHEDGFLWSPRRGHRVLFVVPPQQIARIEVGDVGLLCLESVRELLEAIDLVQRGCCE